MYFIMMGLLLSSVSLADYTDALNKIQQAQSTLRGSFAEAKNCVFPNQASCDGGAYCTELEKNSDSLYLYKNAQGKGLPNFPLMKFSENLEGCFDVVPIEYTEDPLLNIEKLKTQKTAGSAPALISNRLLWEKEQDKIKPLVEETRQRILDILESRKNGQNDADIEKFKERIKLIRLASTNEVLVKSVVNTDNCELPNALMDSATSTLFICPQLLRMPTATIMMVLAHEMGHTIDPCNISGALYDDNVKKGSYPDIPSNKAAISKAGKKIGEGVGLPSNPFASVISCLQGKTSIQVPLPETIAAFENERACKGVSEDQQMQEGFSDWVSSQVLKKKVSEIQDAASAKQFALESQLLFLGIGCSNISTRVSDRLMASIDQKQKSDLKARCQKLGKTQDDPTHPLTTSRIGRLFFVPKEMQKALNCKPTGAVECK